MSAICIDGNDVWPDRRPNQGNVAPVKQQRSALVTTSPPRESLVEWQAEPGAVLPSNGLDRNCIERAKAHDEEAARTLVQELYPLVIKIVRSHRPRRMDEDELVQIIFVKVFQKLDQWAGEAPLAHWVSKLAVNTCLNELRSEKARPELRWADLNEDENTALQQLLQGVEENSSDHQVGTRDLANRLLELVSPQDRVILTMLDLEGRTAREAAQLLGTNATLVKVRAFRARQKLRKHLEKLELEGTGNET